MANVDSAIGYVAGAIANPSPTTTDSAIGYGVGVITDPVSRVADSAIGYVAGVLTNPAPTVRDSAIGYAVGRIAPTHTPILVRTDDGLRKMPIRVWVGTAYRPALPPA